MKLVVINGPNLNLLGKREPEVYGTVSLAQILQQLTTDFPTIEISHYQSNLEGELVTWIQDFGLLNNHAADGIILNPGGYSHTSVAIADAIAACKIPVIEVHLSNIYARESYRHQSITGSKCAGIISGFGHLSYWLAVHYFLSRSILTS